MSRCLNPSASVSGPTNSCEARAAARLHRTVRIWDPATAASLLAVPVSSGAKAISGIEGNLAIGLTAGILVIEVTSLP
jgi:hypothetical protein